MRKIVSLLIAVFAVLASVMPIWAADLNPPNQFASYPAEMHYGEIAPLRWNDSNSPEWVFPRMADQILHVLERKGFTAESKEVFGGHYLLQTVGCGTYCQSGVIIDLRTGMLTSQLPYAWYGYEWRPDSNLLVVNPWDSNAPSDTSRPQSTEYYVWDGTNFQLIREEKWITEWKGVAIGSNGSLFFSTLSSKSEVEEKLAESCYYSGEDCFQGVIVPASDWMMYLGTCGDISFSAALNQTTGEIRADSREAKVSVEKRPECSFKELF